MQVGLLGPVMVAAADGTRTAVGGPRVRALLGLLALEAGRVVSAGRLVDGVWGEDPPAGTGNALQTLVSRLRTAVPMVRSDGGGYVLDLPPEAVDVHLFTREIEAGRTSLADGAAERAVACFDAALARWRGEPLIDAGESEVLRAAALRLTELRLDAVELRADALRALGRGGEVVRELHTELAAHPFRETLAARLVRALAAAGRTSEAVRQYQRVEALLREELGTTPAEALRSALADVHPDLADVHPDAPPDRPSAARAATPRVSAPLPTRRTSFVGRGPDVAGVRRALREARLVTLSGTGGVGKTRLAAETIGAHAEDWADGYAFVELAALERERADRPTVTAVGVAIANALTRFERPDELSTEWAEVLERTLSGRRMLLVLDNCEHVVAAVARLVDDLLQRLPLLRVLATTREPLGVDGERLYPVRTLDLPEADADFAAATASPAVRLFVDRATAVLPDFVLSERNSADVRGIVHSLDGMPLAIELAAARLRSLPLPELGARLTDRFRLLTNSTRHAVPRHRTLQAAIAWSWELLTAAEVAAARRFSVFAGGASLAAVTRVCGPDAIDMVDSLVAKSLVDFDGQRYRMAETIRAYATAELTAAGEADEVARIHADYFLDFTDSAIPGLRTAAQPDWLARLIVEHSNCDAALRWALDAGDGERAVRLYANLVWYWLLRGLHGDISARRREVLALVGDTPPPGCTGAYLACRYAEELPAYFTNIWWGQIRDDTGQFERLTRAALTETRPPHPMFVLILALRDLLGDDEGLLTECTTSDDPWLRGNSLIAKGFDELGGDHPARALPTLEAAVAGLGAHGDARSHSRALISLASYRTRMLGLDSARPLITRAVELLSPDLGAAERVGVHLFAAEMYLVGGDTHSAATHLEHAEGSITPHMVPSPGRFLAATQAHLAHLRGDNDLALRLFQRMSEHPLPAGPPPAGRHDTVRFVNLVFVSTVYAATLVAADRPDDALRELAGPREVAAQTSAALLAEVGIGYALVDLAQGAPGRAARILGATDRINRRAGVSRVGPFRRRALDQAEAALGPVRSSAEFLAGARLTDGAVLELLRTER
ncbi:BTAD domain-containing putative transcriptional regulator [Nocardia sp. CDC153]|uniref:BTAD domain-containing putative transcriptional regulator n=1 Tax=Nocardia sp. CDC153 TaxID=3112167 RepID=UPI002DB92D5D|nr:BTAD domain-containing putative transcriptional regulator [Nocardia sp. CDC153]MEC3958248.1 BTAD domain-containing putative transcriptional regulator [Nocardia sp. CDC153]